MLLLFRLGGASGIAEFEEQAGNLCIQGVTLGKLEVDDLQKRNMSLQELWDCTIPAWGKSCDYSFVVVVVYPNVFDVPEGGFRYSELVVTDIDAPLRMGGRLPGTYFLQAYEQHRHQDQPASTSRSSGHYIAHFKMQLCGTPRTTLPR